MRWLVLLFACAQPEPEDVTIASLPDAAVPAAHAALPSAPPSAEPRLSVPDLGLPDRSLPDDAPILVFCREKHRRYAARQADCRGGPADRRELALDAEEPCTVAGASL